MPTASDVDLGPRDLTPQAVALLGTLTGGDSRQTDVVRRLAVFLSGLEDADAVTDRHVRAAHDLHDKVDGALDPPPAEPGGELPSGGRPPARRQRGWAAAALAVGVVAALVVWPWSKPAVEMPPPEAVVEATAAVEAAAPVPDSPAEPIAREAAAPAGAEMSESAASQASPTPDVAATPDRLPAGAILRVFISVPKRDQVSGDAAKTLKAQLERGGIYVSTPVTRRDPGSHGILYFFAEDAMAAQRVARAVGGDADPVLTTANVPPGTVEIALPLTRP